MGNRVYTDPNNADAYAAIEAKRDTEGYLSKYSDVVALMVFEHQMRMMNLLTRFGWELRVAAYDKQAFDPGPDACEIVDYMPLSMKHHSAKRCGARLYSLKCLPPGAHATARGAPCGTSILNAA